MKGQPERHALSLGKKLRGNTGEKKQCLLVAFDHIYIIYTLISSNRNNQIVVCLAAHDTFKPVLFVFIRFMFPVY